MKYAHFEALAPVCPACRAASEAHRLHVGLRTRSTDAELLFGTLLCSNPACQREYPVIDGIPILLAQVRPYIEQYSAIITQRDDLDPVTESLIGDGCGPAHAFNTVRQHVSTYASSHYDDLDPSAPEPSSGLVEVLDRSLELAGIRSERDLPEGVVVDLGCATGRNTFELADRLNRPVVGIDLHFAMLKVARRVLTERQVRYGRRRVGIVYEPRQFPVHFKHVDRVDFWACDAQALPLPVERIAHLHSSNLLDCLPSPYEHLGHLAAMLAPGAAAALVTPYDWSPGVTPVENWLGGHSQRGPDGGSSEALLRRLLSPADPAAIPTLRLIGEEPDMPWRLRLHARSVAEYSVHVAVARRHAGASTPQSTS